MIEEIRHWFVLFKARRLYQRLVKSKVPSFEEAFKRRVTYLAAMLELQFGGVVTVSHEKGKATIVRNSLVFVEVTIFQVGTYTRLVVKTNIEPEPRWWLSQVFAGMKWKVRRFPTMRQLTYQKPRGP